MMVENILRQPSKKPHWDAALPNRGKSQSEITNPNSTRNKRKGREKKTEGIIQGFYYSKKGQSRFNVGNSKGKNRAQNNNGQNKNANPQEKKKKKETTCQR